MLLIFPFCFWDLLTNWRILREASIHTKCKLFLRNEQRLPLIKFYIRDHTNSYSCIIGYKITRAKPIVIFYPNNALTVVLSKNIICHNQSQRFKKKVVHSEILSIFKCGIFNGIFQKFVNRLVENAESDPSQALVEASKDLSSGYKLASELVKAGKMTAERGQPFCIQLEKIRLQQCHGIRTICQIWQK